MPDTTRQHNVTLIHRSLLFQRFLTHPHRIKSLFKPFLPQRLQHAIIAILQVLNQTKPPQLAPELRCQLTEGYREDILKLQVLIGRDLSQWLKTP